MNTKRIAFQVGSVSLLICLSILAFVWRLWSSSEPSYKGQSLSVWLQDFSDGSSEAKEAVSRIGTNSLPFLLDWIERKDNKAKREFLKRLDKRTATFFNLQSAFHWQWLACNGFEILGTNGLPALPRLSALLNDTNTSRAAAMAIARIGSEGFATLSRALTNRNATIRCHAALAIEAKHHAPDFVVVTLATALHDKDFSVRFAAAEALGRIGNDSQVAISALLERIYDTNRAVRVAALDALGNIRPRSDAVIVIIRKATNDVDILVRNRAISALNRIEKEREKGVNPEN